MDERPITIWAVSDGRAGIENQALGLAEAVARLTPASIVRKHVRFRENYDRLPTGLKLHPRRFLAADADPIEPPWPDLWIAAGRATMPFSLRMRRWSKGKTFVVQVQDPRWPPQMFDAVVPPRHDRVVGPNVIDITGSPHRVTPEKLDDALVRFRDLVDPLPHPRVAVLIGGKSKAFDISPERASRLAAEIALAVETEKGSVMVTFSRRTPQRARDLLASRLKPLPGIVWDGEGANPYFAFLAAADYVLVTEDSTNMATEAASTGKPVFILKMDGESLKFRRFHEELERRDVARPFGGTLYRWDYPPLRETDWAATDVLARMRARAG
ncbi:mitochondrial fission ELM1 family protein [Caulobacter sp. 17J80-11]|nr:mitochondrial fission ELM1 family protein [Caulobacter sp. 17J80-11]MBC6980493.1 mitochondrial fission ELM1 family protein [Caulobacter sp. 17J80-11]